MGMVVRHRSKDSHLRGGERIFKRQIKKPSEETREGKEERSREEIILSRDERPDPRARERHIPEGEEAPWAASQGEAKGHRCRGDR